MQSCSLQNLQLRVELLSRGAEMVRFRTVSGVDLLWDGDPDVWPRHAPVLFPVVGRLSEDRLIHEGKHHPMPKHGFARDMDFILTRITREDCTFVLRDNERTRSMFPFPFELRITYALEGMTLHVVYDIANPGPTALPFSLGAHPAFRWPLSPGVAKDAHVVRFEMPEPAPVRQLNADGLLRRESFPTPVKDRTLALRPDLFQTDALIFDQLQSHRIRYEAPGTPMLQMEWRGFNQLGIWSKPGADFLCLEPWHGLASEEGFHGEFSDRPGVLVIEPQGRRTLTFAVTVSLDF